MKQKSGEQIYKELRKKYTDEEIAESMVLPSDLSPEEKEKSDKEFSEFIKKRRESMSWKTKLRIRYLYVKYRLEDLWKKS